MIPGMPRGDAGISSDGLIHSALIPATPFSITNNTEINMQIHTWDICLEVPLPVKSACIFTGSWSFFSPSVNSI